LPSSSSSSSSGLKGRRGTRPECSGYHKWANPRLRVSTWTIMASSSGLKRRRGCQTWLFRVPEMGTTPPVINLGNLCMHHQDWRGERVPEQNLPVIINGHQNPSGCQPGQSWLSKHIKYPFLTYIFITGRSDPAPTSASSTGCMLLLSCGWMNLNWVNIWFPLP
jgi:hypothetical protein